MADKPTAEWTLTIGGYTPRTLHHLAEKVAPQYVEHWRDQMLDNYSPEDDGGEDAGGNTSIEIRTLAELMAALQAFGNADLGLSCQTTTDAVRAWAVLGCAIQAATVDINRELLDQRAWQAIRAARKCLDGALEGAKHDG